MLLKICQFLFSIILFIKVTECQSDAFVTRFNPNDVDYPGQGDVLPSVFTCGVGDSDSADDHTWMARLRYEKNDYGCGGVVLNGRYILTAASCLKGEVTERLGALLSVTVQENSGYGLVGKEYEIEETVRHEDYVPNTIHGANDVALIRLAKNINLEQTIPICVNGFPIDKTNAPYVAGWGQTHSGHQTETPQQLRLRYIDEYSCTERLGRYEYQLADQDICTELNESDYEKECPLDGGGGLYKNVLSRWFVIGIAPYNGVCGHYIVPGVYTKFNDVYKWVVNNIRP